MKRLTILASLLAMAATSSAQVGQRAKLDVERWYNSPPISADQLQGHTVMIEVFRTW